MPSKSVGINVVVRFRPVADPSQHLKKSSSLNFRIAESKSIGMRSRKGKDLMFHLDTVLGDTTTQEEMFEAVGEPITRDVLQGYNGTVFVYGQTGSGKTHSLFGDMSDREATARGIIPRSCQRIFEHFESAEDVEEVSIKCSFVEIYLEQLQDLLCPQNNGSLKIRQHVDHSIYVQGLHEEFVSSFDDVYDLLQLGFRNRVVASTKMNSESSRSHCVLILKIKQTAKGGTVKESKINFADLAGSEKVKKSGATADVLEQAKAINKSLSALGNVIAKLTAKDSKHVPYRDSQLTHLLKDALSGNTKTTLVIACSSDQYNAEETVGTLRFATRAKQIVNKVTANKQVSAKELALMVQVLKKALGDQRADGQRMLDLLKSVRAGDGDKEQIAAQIDELLAQMAARKSKGKKSKKRKKGKNAKSKNDAVDEAKEDDLEDDDDDDDDEPESKQEELETLKAANYELAEQMEKMQSSLDAKDDAVDGLNDEVAALKRSVLALKLQKTAMAAVNAMRSERDEEEAKASEASTSTKQDDVDDEEKDGAESASEDLKAIIDEHVRNIDALKLENEHLKEDSARLARWNQELRKARFDRSVSTFLNVAVPCSAPL